MSVSTRMLNADVPTSIRTLLRTVRLRIRRDAAVGGLLLLLIGLMAVFWGTTLIESGWFQLQRLELPVGLRTIVSFAVLASGGVLAIQRVIFPLIRLVTDTEVAVLVERRFPQFQDRLITSVESTSTLSDGSPVPQALVARTRIEASRLAESVAVADVFDPAQLKRRAIVAACLATTILATGLFAPRLIQQWWNAFVRVEVSYRQRTTLLNVQAITQPGDRRVDFIASGDAFVVKHPHGADLELEMTVPDGGPSEGQSWIVPDRVRVDLLRADGTRSRTYVSPSSDRTFRFVVTRLQEPVELELLAGDYRTTSPYRVDIVAMPGLDQIELDCRYPDYTGWNQLRERKLIVTGSEVELPVGTEFQLHARSAKPLQSVRIVSDQFELTGDRTSWQVHPLEQADSNGVVHSPQPMVSADGYTITAAFRIHGTEPDAATGTTAAMPTPDTDTRLRIPSSTNLRFFLHDEDDVMSISPETLRVQGIADSAPVVVAQMTGVGNAITRLARIPITGRIRDDYGIDTAGFEFLVDDESTWRPRPFRNPPQRGLLEFEPRRSDDEPFEVFEVQPLELSEGQTLTVSVVASDLRPVPAPGTSRGDPMVFRIVSNEELLSLLYTREIGLRGRFEEVIAQLDAVANDLQFHQEVARRTDAAGPAALSEDRSSLSTCAARSGNALRRQANELQAITEGFDEIVRQLINNAIPPQTLADNMRSSIVDPLRAVAARPVPAADRAIGAFRAAVQDQQPSASLTQAAAGDVSDVVAELRRILDSVRDLAEFHEALRDLKAILDEQEQLLDKTKQLQKKELLDKLKVLD